MPESFLSRRTRFGVSGALLILIIFFFLLPSTFRGARLAIAGKKNNIKDWLPSDFRETVELEWFAKYFVGESFVVATWDGCTDADQRLKLFASKLRSESAERDLSGEPEDIQRARELAEKLKLLVEPEQLTNWGGLGEKWFATPSGQHYYITPDGRFYRWNSEANVVSGLARAFQRMIGSYELKGQFLTAFGEPSTANKANTFYNDPTLLAASLFQQVQTGADLANELAKEGGPLWPIDLTDASERAEVAKARAIERLTGTMFAPAVPDDFDWTPAAVRRHLQRSGKAELPADFDQRVQATVTAIEGELAAQSMSLTTTTAEQRTAAWQKVCAAVGVAVPPRQTCVLVTLTPFGKEHLARAIGRGVIGAPRGRMLILADESGLAAAPPPSMAPPPFDRPESQLADASGRPMLRIGGPPVDNVAIDEEGTVTLIRLVGYSGLVGIGIAYLCFRSIKLTTMIFMVGLTSAVLGLAITYWAGGHVDAILMTMPSMVYISGLSGAIHIVNYARDEAYERGAPGAIMRAVKHAWGPAFLCSFTTALGLFSLCSSNLVPIRNFGLYTGIAVMTMLLILFTFIPSALEAFPPRFLRLDLQTNKKSSSRSNDSELSHNNSWVSNLWGAIGRWITQHYTFVTISCAILLVISTTGIFKINTTVQLLKLFDEDSRIISDYAYLEQNFGKLVPMEVVVRIPRSMQAEHQAAPDDSAAPGQRDKLPADQAQLAAASSSFPLTVLERVEAVGRIDQVARRALGDGGIGVIGNTMSAVTFLPPLPEPSAGYSPVRALFQNNLRDSLPNLQETDCYRVEKGGPRDGSELWRISLRVGALSNVDYGQFVEDLRQTVNPVLNAYRARSMILQAVNTSLAPDRRAANPRILFVGSSEPQRLSMETLIDRAALKADKSATSVTGSAVRASAIYAATLAELMAGEKVKRPWWIDPSSNTKLNPGDERWQKLVESADCVVLISDQAKVDVASLAKTAKCFVDIRPEKLPAAEPTLNGGVPVDGNAGPLEAIYTGIVPVVYKSQRTLLASLIESTIMASVAISLTMAFLMVPGYFPGVLLNPGALYNGLMAGMVAMVPNMFPIVLVFGVMGHINFLVDIGTMMTASVALGIAVDDTIHFLSWFRQYIDQGVSRVEAVVETYRRVGPAMMQTAFVGGLGMFVFALSTFTPTQRFGTLMLILLLTALLGDLVLLPALLAGPLGKFFRPRTPSRQHGPVAAHPESDPQPLENLQTASVVAAPASDPARRHAGVSGPGTPKSFSKANETSAARGRHADQ